MLSSSIWNISTQRIQEDIETLEEYNLENFITNSVLRKSRIQMIALINYLAENELSLVIDEKLNPIFNVAPCVLRKKYNID